MSYYNTTNETQPELFQHRDKAAKQDDLVLEYFLNVRPIASPSQVHRECLPNAPLTSVRRAISNLTAAGKLVKTGEKVKGDWGRLEYCWKLQHNTRTARANGLPLSKQSQED